MPFKILLGILIIFITCKGNDTKKISPKGVNGVLDLRSVEVRDRTYLQPWDFEKDGVIQLDGEWEFYWKEFVPPNSHLMQNEEFRMKDGENSAFLIPHSAFITVPGSWNQFIQNEKAVGGQGYGTYRLRVFLPPNVFSTNDKPFSLGIKLLSVGTAYKLYVNGNFVTEVGKIGKTKEESIPAFLSQVISIQPDKQEIELKVIVSNFHYSRGGLWSSIRIGSLSELQKEREKNLLLDFFIFCNYCQ